MNSLSSFCKLTTALESAVTIQIPSVGTNSKARTAPSHENVSLEKLAPSRIDCHRSAISTASSCVTSRNDATRAGRNQSVRILAHSV
jgi:hypothetical protein